MKISLALLVLVTVTQLGTSNILSKRGIQELSSDENGIQNGSDIIMVNSGPLEVILTNGSELVFEVCSSKCSADFLVCYEADSPGQNVIELCDSKSGFYVTTRGDKISIMESLTNNALAGNVKIEECESFSMINPETAFRSLYVPSCSPKVENGMVKLNIVNASSECPVIIKNAILKPDPTTSAPTTPGRLTVTSPTNENGSATTDDESGSFIGNYWWIFLIVGILIIAVFVGIVVYCCIRRKSKKAKKTVAPPRKLRESKSPIVLQPSTEPAKTQSEATPASVFQQSSILSHKSLMWSKKEDGNKYNANDENNLGQLKNHAKKTKNYLTFCQV